MMDGNLLIRPWYHHLPIILGVAISVFSQWFFNARWKRTILATVRKVLDLPHAARMRAFAPDLAKLEEQARRAARVRWEYSVRPFSDLSWDFGWPLVLMLSIGLAAVVVSVAIPLSGYLHVPKSSVLSAVMVGWLVYFLIIVIPLMTRVAGWGLGLRSPYERGFPRYLTDPRRALRYFRRALLWNPRSLRAYYALGASLLENGRIEEAATRCARFQKIYPESAIAHELAARIECARGDLAAAANHYRQAAEAAVAAGAFGFGAEMIRSADAPPQRPHPFQGLVLACELEPIAKALESMNATSAHRAQ